MHLSEEYQGRLKHKANMDNAGLSAAVGKDDITEVLPEEPPF
jgi:hypothetical protein